MMGSFIKLGDFGTVSSGCYLERKVATSPGHAETYAMQSVVKDVTWFRHLLSELQHPQLARTTVTTDNDGVRIQSTKPINYSKARHFRVSQAYVRGKEEDGTIDVQRVDTDQNPADLFTKPLHSLLFVRHRSCFCVLVVQYVCTRVGYFGIFTYFFFFLLTSLDLSAVSFCHCNVQSASMSRLLLRASTSQ
jgi:hypothetical protein